MLRVFLGGLAFFVVIFSSSHYLVLLLVVEIIVLLVFFLIINYAVRWLLCLIFLLVGVCMGAYGVCLLVSLGRDKGALHIISFSF